MTVYPGRARTLASLESGNTRLSSGRAVARSLHGLGARCSPSPRADRARAGCVDIAGRGLPRPPGDTRHEAITRHHPRRRPLRLPRRAVPSRGESGPAAGPVQLRQILSGLNTPDYVTNARDGSNRLFIVEQAGIIKVLQPGSRRRPSSSTSRTKVLSGGEQGLLGLAFHPHFATNRRFFVNYTRTPRRRDGDRRVPRLAANPNVAEHDRDGPADHRAALRQPQRRDDRVRPRRLPLHRHGRRRLRQRSRQPRAEHRTSSSARSCASTSTIPNGRSALLVAADNPFFGADGGARRDLTPSGCATRGGSRFDRGDGRALRRRRRPGRAGGDRHRRRAAATTAGASSRARCCTRQRPGLVQPRRLRARPSPSTRTRAGRCSVTGGYVYRGRAGTSARRHLRLRRLLHGRDLHLPERRARRSLLDAYLSISSFGEDEAGEIYVVGLGGTLHRIATPAPCAFTLTPASKAYSSRGTPSARVRIATTAGCPWTAVSNAPWIRSPAERARAGVGALLRRAERGDLGAHGHDHDRRQGVHRHPGRPRHARAPAAGTRGIRTSSVLNQRFGVEP